MLRNTGTLEGYSLRATDGEIGAAEDFYFDDQAWAVRYLFIDTGRWLPERKVLISPISLGKIDKSSKTIEVELTKEQVKNSPDIDTHKPISRQHEAELCRYYAYPYYWVGPYLWGPAYCPVAPIPMDTRMPEQKEIEAAKNRQSAKDQHLRSVREVGKYLIEASDGEIGHVEDFLVEDRTWTIDSLVVDTRNWWPGKKVLIARQAIFAVSWLEWKVYVNVSRETIKSGAEYDPSAVSRENTKLRVEHNDKPVASQTSREYRKTAAGF
jgi:hypothetical protein